MSDEILVLGFDDSSGKDRIFGVGRSQAKVARDKVSPEELKKRLDSFVSSMGDVVSGVPDKLADYQVNEISFTAEVSATGKVGLLGTGVDVTGGGGITITLTRKDGQQ